MKQDPNFAYVTPVVEAVTLPGIAQTVYRCHRQRIKPSQHQGGATNLFRHKMDRDMFVGSFSFRSPTWHQASLSHTKPCFVQHHANAARWDRLPAHQVRGWLLSREDRHRRGVSGAAPPRGPGGPGGEQMWSGLRNGGLSGVMGMCCFYFN